MVAGLPAEFGIAALAFVGTNVDNVLVTTAMVATAPHERARRIAAGQVAGFVVLVLVAVAAAIALFDVPTWAIGLSEVVWAWTIAASPTRTLAAATRTSREADD